jgi:hypothetical protein
MSPTMSNISNHIEYRINIQCPSRVIKLDLRLLYLSDTFSGTVHQPARHHDTYHVACTYTWCMLYSNLQYKCHAHKIPLSMNHTPIFSTVTMETSHTQCDVTVTMKTSHTRCDVTIAMETSHTRCDVTIAMEISHTRCDVTTCTAMETCSSPTLHV